MTVLKTAARETKAARTSCPTEARSDFIHTLNSVSCCNSSLPKRVPVID